MQPENAGAAPSRFDFVNAFTKNETRRASGP
jgi:hypothetical protein